MVPFSFPQPLLKSRVMQKYTSSFLVAHEVWNQVLLPFPTFLLSLWSFRPAREKPRNSNEFAKIKINQGKSSLFFLFQSPEAQVPPKPLSSVAVAKEDCAKGHNFSSSPFLKYRTTSGWAFRTSRKSASFCNWRACQSQELTRLRTEICGARLSASRLPQVYASRKRVAI